MDRQTIWCGLGTNTGLKRMDAAQHGATYKDLLYAWRRYVTVEQLREAVAMEVSQQTEATAACLSVSSR